MQLNIIAMSRCLQEPKSGPDLPDESVVTEKILAIIEERLGPDRYKTFMQFVKATKLKAWYSDFINGIATNIAFFEPFFGMIRVYQFDLVTAINGGHKVIMREDLVKGAHWGPMNIYSMLAEFFTITRQDYAEDSSAHRQMLAAVKGGNKVDIGPELLSPMLDDEGISFPFRGSGKLRYTAMAYKGGSITGLQRSTGGQGQERDTICCWPVLAVVSRAPGVLMAPAQPMTPGSKSGGTNGIAVDVQMRGSGCNHMGNLPPGHLWSNESTDCTAAYMKQAR